MTEIGSVDELDGCYGPAYETRLYG